MKFTLNNLSLSFLFFLVIASTTLSCEDDDQIVDLPQSVDNYISSNYPNYTIDEAEEEEYCPGTIYYEVEIENDADEEVELVFDAEGNFLFTVEEIEVDALPAAVIDQISLDYPGYEIDEAERLDLATDDQQYIVEIENEDAELEILMEADGSIICIIEEE